MRILVTNDDGIHAPGLVSLERIAQALSDDVWTVAPETEQSGSSHSLTLHEPVRLRRLGPQRYAVSGTPTDCVVMGLKHLVEEAGNGKAFDLVLSGVNRGSNLADDVTYSGTIAGAMEGTVLGVPSIALSQAYGFDPKGEGIRFEVAEAFGPALIRSLVEAGWPAHVLLNINFPDCEIAAVERIELTRQGVRDQSNLFVDKRTDPRGNAYYWIGFSRRLSNPPEGTDLRAIYEGRITVTPLHLNLTETAVLEPLAQSLSEATPSVLKAGVDGLPDTSAKTDAGSPHG